MGKGKPAKLNPKAEADKKKKEELDKKKKKEPPKKPPPPPKCFNAEDLARFQEIFKLYDEDGIERIPLPLIPTMLRKLGFNPKEAEIQTLCTMFLEDEFMDTIELWHWYLMIEQKKKWGDDCENDVIKSIQFLVQDEKETGFGSIELLETELMQWGDPLTEIEWKDFPKAALKEKSLDEHGVINYNKFVDRMNAKDVKFAPEPVNFWKLDQKTLAAMAAAKREVELAEMAKKEAERKAREEYKRQKMIEAGLIQLD